jgi:hypothetical protein
MKYIEIVNEALETFYHGSSNLISEFNLDNVGGENAINQEGPGIYLTSSADDAKKYGNHIHEVKVRMSKARMMPDQRTIKPEFVRGLIAKSPIRDEVLQNWDENQQRAMHAAVEGIMSSYGPNDYREAMEQIWADFYSGHEREWLSRMRSNGWDGFVLQRNDGVKHFICFTPEILKIVGVTNL